MNSISTIFLADSHLGYDHPLKPRSERKRRGEDFFKNFEDVLDLAIETKVDFVVHGGDLFDSPHVNEALVNRAYFKIFELAETGIPIFIVPGNHERAKLPGSIYMQHPNIHIFNEAKTVRIECRMHAVSISGFPYYYDGIRLDFPLLQKTLTKDLNPDELNIMCMHQVLEGAQVGLHNYTFRANNDVIRVEDLTDDYICYLSGHIHRQQIIRNPENNVPFIYSGSVERTSFQEASEAKGYYSLRFSKRDNKYDMHCKFIELPTRPLETIAFENRIYSAKEVRDLISKKVNQISENAVLRYISEYPENLYMITGKLEKELIPYSISLQKGIWSPGKGYKSKKRV